jgi:spore maturation protein CgeB
MKVALFCHSILSDWNHGNAHFLRGIASELRARGAEVGVWEAIDAWSARNLEAERGELPVDELDALYPLLGVRRGGVVRYAEDALDLDAALDGVDLCLVHEWSEPALVSRIGDLRKRGGRFVLLFHDTHHRSVSAPAEMARYDLSGYDGVLAFGAAVARIWEDAGWGRRVFVWHEAADTRVFRPCRPPPVRRDVCWIGNWGDDERAAELREFLLTPVHRLGLSATVRGVRYPEAAIRALADSRIEYGGWVANYRVPRVFAAHRITVHVPRSPYARALPGIPTIRPFEALACGIPPVSAPWDDVEGLFVAGRDYLLARSGAEMEDHLRLLLRDPPFAEALVDNGLRIVRERHTCAHRVDELLAVFTEITRRPGRAAEVPCASRSSEAVSCPPTGTGRPPTTAG